MQPRPRLVLLGKQGAGKGTQAVRISEHYDIAHFSTGDLFRELARLETEFGLKAKEYMDAGELVPDETVLGVVTEALEPGGPLGEGFVLDGFPRTLGQAESFETILDGHPLDLVVNLDVPLEIVLDRISGRRVCVDCQRVYHVTMPPEVPWVCDTCGHEVVQRDDDTEEAVERRLEAYETDTKPILDFYREIGKHVRVVNGVGEGDAVFDRIVSEIDTTLAPS
ncbi:MAG TPA: adenylate kinase [Acidimicrobiia bacterium]|jgi:adenylate kinase|nr:adenylate kinase [Acidimicrobiia bacterium]